MVPKSFFIGLFMCLTGIALVLLTTSSRFRATEQRIAQLESSLLEAIGKLDAAQGSLDSLQDRAPGLGEYMSTIQLHSAKLWYGGRAKNWKLAVYELDELGETVEAAERLHAVKNGVDVSSVLRSVQDTQLAALRRFIVEERGEGFRNAYGELLAACNGCHRTAGYAYIHIVVPTREPVANQRWEAR
jgi:hypothetical protein